MSEEQSLDDLLNDVEPQAVEAAAEAGEAAPEPEAEPAVEAKADETEKPTEEAETPEAKQEEAPKSDDSESWTKAAVLDERRKRQELERKIAEYEAASAKQDGPKRPDVFEDQEGAFGHVEQTLQQQIQSTAHNIRLELSQDMMRMVKPDYDEVESEFIDLAKENPALIKELQESSNPARFAYDTAIKAREAAELKNVDEYKAKIKAELRAELEAELKAQMEQSEAKQAQKNQALTPSLAAAQSKGGVDEFRDESLESIFG